MYVLALILFAGPCFLMSVAWRRALVARKADSKAGWRTNCLIAALVMGSFTIAAVLSFVFAWLYAGGNPHGMGTPPGIWQSIRWVFWSALLASLGLTALAKGRGRFVNVAAVISAFLADFAVIRLNFD